MKNGGRKVTKKKQIIIIAAVVLCVCAAVYLNMSYNNQSNGEDAFADSALANAKSEEEAQASAEDYLSEYFAEARLTRQQSRDEAMELLEQAASADTASQETIDGAMNSIAAMASYSMQETQIENLILAKNFADCVAFMSADGITLAVPAPAEGLSTEDVAKIVDCIVNETDYTAAQVRIIEVKKPTTDTAGDTAENTADNTVEDTADNAADSTAENDEAAVLPEGDTTLNDEVIE
ncbi:MAG: SpoIIIAH-like family protein [Clostridia bacterium]|nr:SpoIIIAH-like family protein [Clostridia bacterium]